MKKTLVWIMVASFACLVLVTGLSDVIANAERVFAGKVLLLDKRPPSWFSSKNGFVKFLRNHKISTVHENGNQQWSFETMAFFKRPLGDYEVEMVFYNIEDGKSKNQRQFVDSFTQYTQDRNTRSLSCKTKLIRPQFDANIRYMVIASSHGKELAKGEFTTKGTSQAAIDQDKRVTAMQAEMEEKMKELEKAAKEQEEREKKAREQGEDF